MTSEAWRLQLRLELSLVPNKLKVVFVLQTVGEVGLLRAQADFCCHQRLCVPLTFYLIATIVISPFLDYIFNLIRW